MLVDLLDSNETKVKLSSVTFLAKKLTLKRRKNRSFASQLLSKSTRDCKSMLRTVYENSYAAIMRSRFQRAVQDKGGGRHLRRLLRKRFPSSTRNRTNNPLFQMPTNYCEENRIFIFSHVTPCFHIRQGAFLGSHTQRSFFFRKMQDAHISRSGIT